MGYPAFPQGQGIATGVPSTSQTAVGYPPQVQHLIPFPVHTGWLEWMTLFSNNPHSL